MTFNVHTYAEEAKARRQRLYYPRGVRRRSLRKVRPVVQAEPIEACKSAQEPVPAWEPAPPLCGEIILAEVAEKHGVSILEMKSVRRQKHLVKARQEFCYRMKKETSHSYPMIGRMLGGRDHTTILHGVRRHEALLGKAPETSERGSYKQWTDSDKSTLLEMRKQGVPYKVIATALSTTAHACTNQYRKLTKRGAKSDA